MNPLFRYNTSHWNGIMFVLSVSLFLFRYPFFLFFYLALTYWRAPLQRVKKKAETLRGIEVRNVV